MLIGLHHLYAYVPVRPTAMKLEPVLSANKAQEVVGERLDAKHGNPGRPPEYRFPWNGGHGLTHLRGEVSLLFHSIDTLSVLRRVSLNTPPRGVSTIGARSPFSNPSVTSLDSPACKPGGVNAAIGLRRRSEPKSTR